jgi:hypothetical protein
MQTVPPEVVSELMFSWYVWASIFLGTAIMTVIGTYLITRRWPE